MGLEKNCEKNRLKVFAKITELLLKMNEIIDPYGVKFGAREEYSIEYLEEILSKFAELAGLDLQKTVRGRGHHKTAEQRLYERLFEYLERLKKYAEHIKICGEDCGSYSKTDRNIYANEARSYGKQPASACL